MRWYFLLGLDGTVGMVSVDANVAQPAVSDRSQEMDRAAWVSTTGAIVTLRRLEVLFVFFSWTDSSTGF